MSLKGNAGFRYTPSGGTEKTHALNWPMKLQMAPAHRQNRWTVDSLNLSAHEVISIASGRMEVSAMLRFNSKSQDLIDMLRHAANGIVVTYYPDLAVNTSYDLWLVGPSGDSIELAWDQARYGLGEYQIPVRFRDASASGTSLEALFSPWLFRYDAGMARDDITFTRTGTARQVGQFGVLESVAENLPRDGHWPLVDGVRTPSLLLEKAATNDLLDSADIDGGANWTETGTWVQADATSIIDGQTANRQTNDNGAANRNIRQSTPNLVASPIVVSFIVENVDAVTTTIGLRDDTASGWVVQATYTWATGAVVVTDDGAGSATGARAITLAEAGPNGGRVVRIEAWGTADNATNSGTARIYPTGLDQNALAAILHHAQHEDGTVATSPIVTTSSAGTRNVDTLYLPYVHAPQESTGYMKFVEGGTDTNTSTDRIFQIGSATAADDPRFTVFSSSGGGYRASYDDGVTAVTSPAVLTRPSAGDVVELVPFLHVDDEDNVTVSVQQSINGGAAEDSGLSPSSAKLKSAYAAQRIYLNSAGSSGHGAVALISIKHASGTKTLQQMRDL